MSEEKEKIVLISTHAGEDPERAIFPMMLANAAQAMDVEAVVVLQGNGVYLVKKGLCRWHYLSRPDPHEDAGGQLRRQWRHVSGLNSLPRGAQDQSG